MSHQLFSGGVDMLLPQDAVPYEASLDRLLRNHVRNDEQLMDYELNQALRGVFVAVKSTARTFAVPLATHTSTGAGGSEQRVYGREAVLLRMCAAAATTPVELPTLTYVSSRLLVDAASAYGEGNARPCCTEEWKAALVSIPQAFLRHDGNGAMPQLKEEQEGGASSAFLAHVAVNRRVQLGYFRLLCGTLRAVASGAVDKQRLFAEHTSLLHRVLEDVLPLASALAEGKADVSSTSTRAVADDGERFHPPTRLTAEANHFVIQTVYWLSMDALSVHLREEQATQKKTHHRVLDRDVPQLLWGQVPRLRAALRRGLGWCREEMHAYLMRCHEKNREARQIKGAGAGVDAPSPSDALTVDVVGCASSEDPLPKQAVPTQALGCTSDDKRRRDEAASAAHSATALIETTIRHLEEYFSRILKEQERAHFARQAAVRQYGEQAKDVHSIDAVLWSGTLRLCMTLQSTTGSWVAAQGGLGLGATTSGVVLASNKDVLLYVASCLSRMPLAEEIKAEGSAGVFAATDALLSALVALVAAAPTVQMQADVWLTGDGSLTREVHTTLTQKGLHAKNETVLKLTSLLLNSIMGSAMGGADGGQGGGGAAQLAGETADQLLEMLSEERDAASHVVVQLLTPAVVHRPHVLIPSLFRLLQHGDHHARRSAMDVLAGLPAIASVSNAKNDSNYVDEHSPLAMHHRNDNAREVLRLLAEQLLLRLRDTELVARMQSAELFAKVWPEDVVVPLLSLCLQRDPSGVKQSAAKAALSQVMRTHTETAECGLLLLRSAFQVFSEATAAPSRDNVSKALRDAGDTEEQMQQNSDESGARPATGPKTPGDIYTRAMLYSATAIGEPQESESSAKEVAGKDNNQQVTATTDVFKTERLHSLLSSLCQLWVESIASNTQQGQRGGGGGLSSREHVLPLLRFMQEASSSDEAQRFYIRHVTNLLSIMTAYATNQEGVENVADNGNSPVVASGESEGGGAAAPSRACHPVVQAIASAFFTDGAHQLVEALPIKTETSGPTTTGPEVPPSFKEYVAALAMKQRDNEPANASPGELYAVLLPLLCIRSVHRRVFSCSTFPTTAPCATAGGGASSQNPVDAIVTELFAVLMDPPCNAFFHQHNDLQRVLIESICKAPPSTVFAHIHGRMGSLPETAGRSGHLFLFRVTLFAVSFYLSNSSTENLHASLGEPSRSFLTQCAEEVASVWDWLRDGGDVIDFMSGSGDQRSGAMLRMSLLDATALVTMLSLHQRDDAAFSCLRAVTTDPLEGSTKGDKESIGLAVECHMHMFRIMQAHPGAAELIVLWLQSFLRPLTERANAACKEETDPFPTAVLCSEVVFHAVMLSGKVGGTATRRGEDPSAPSSRPQVQPSQQSLSSLAAHAAGSADVPGKAAASPSTDSVLLRLPQSDLSALLSFGLGCARFERGLAVQRVGVRILAAFLGAAPDAILALGESAFDEIIGLLRRAARIHQDPATRLLAEQVLAIFPHGMEQY